VIIQDTTSKIYCQWIEIEPKSTRKSMEVKNLDFIMSLKFLFILSILFLSALVISTRVGNGLFFGQDAVMSGETKSIFLSPAQIAATEKGNLYIVWSDSKTVYFTSGLGNQTKLNPAVILSDDNKLVYPPQLYATERGDVYVVWVDKNSTSGDSDIIFRSSNDSGKHFDDSKKLRGSKLLSFSPQISATERGDVYVVWVDKNSTSGDSDIIFRSSNDSGKHFDDSKKLRGSKLLSFSPQISATERGDVYVVWVDKNSTRGDSDIIFRGSNDSGNNFNSRINLNRGGHLLSYSISPQIAATENGNIYVVWTDHFTQFREISDRGGIVGEIVSIGNISATSINPRIAATENGDIFLTWIEIKNTTSYPSLTYQKISKHYFDRNE
jgi:hypothetical protein